MTSAAAPLLQQLLQPLRPWLTASSVEDIAIQKPGEAWIRAAGEWSFAAIPELDLPALEDIATLACALRRQDLDVTSPIHDTQLPGGERLNICIPPTVDTGTVSLSLRKHETSVIPFAEAKQRYRIDNWNKWSQKRRDRDLAEPLSHFQAGDIDQFFAAATRHRLNMLLAGPTGAGKTTLSTSILTYIPPSERLITIEDTIELTITQPNVVRMLYSKDYNDDVSLGPADLTEAALRMRPTRLILQELRDKAAYTYLVAAATGHPGSITTIHGRDAAEALQRLRILAKSWGNVEDSTINQMISNSIDIILPLYETAGETLSRAIGSVWFVGDPDAPSAAELLNQ
jgi:type IV secretion system protein VirB11